MEEQKNVSANNSLSLSIVIGALILAGAWIYTTGQNAGTAQLANLSDSAVEVADLEEAVLPSAGIMLPVKWGDLGAQMVQAGVIDQEQFEALYEARGGLDKDAQKILSGGGNGSIKMTADNAGFLLNLFWALGLANKNPILENGPMSDLEYGGAGNFASTGGWSIAKGDAMDYYSKYDFIILTSAQQDLVERVAKNIYRPCCGNSVYFPDCNHGMAMLGLLELMAAQGVSEKDMYKVALQVNSYWFPDTYLTIAKYLEMRGTPWDKVSPKEVLGINFSSSSGYKKVVAALADAEARKSGGLIPAKKSSGGGCGV